MNSVAPITKPIFVAGFGRSGTNWLLNLLDLHPTTHCRNEPDRLATSLFQRLPPVERPTHATEEFAPIWNKAVEWACTRYGERDRLPRRHKTYLSDLAVDLGLWRLLEKRRVRALLSLTHASLRTAEWTIPWWLDAKDALAHARHVLKLNDRHGWFAWVMENQPESRLLHLVRHPGGVLKSWRKRWFEISDPEVVRRACLARLARIAAIDPAWGQRFGDLDKLDAAAGELWYWRYSTEYLCRHGESSPNYKRLLYEELVSDPARELRAVYEFCELSWGPDIERAIEPEDGSVDAKAHWYERVSVDRRPRVWRNHVSPEDRELIAQVLAQSPMEHWWRDFE